LQYCGLLARVAARRLAKAPDHPETLALLMGLQRPWRSVLESFATEYAGTEAALLAQVDLLLDRVGPAKLAALDTFHRRQRGCRSPESSQM
jgi:hypothetical protein